MCYSGKCNWEDYMGDCRYHSYERYTNNNPKYYCFISNDDYKMIMNNITKIKIIEQRKLKIESINNKLFNKKKV